MKVTEIFAATAVLCFVGVVVAYDASSCGACPDGFVLHGSVGNDLVLGGSARACPWLCKCNTGCFKCNDGDDKGIHVMAMVKGKDENLVASHLDTAETAMGNWINSRMAEVMTVVNPCTEASSKKKIKERSEEEERLGEGSKFIMARMGSYPSPPPNGACSPKKKVDCLYLPDFNYGKEMVDKWHQGNLGTADVWGTYLSMLQTELNADQSFQGKWGVPPSWHLEVKDNKYLEIKREGKGPCPPDQVGKDTCSEGTWYLGGPIYYYAYLSKKTGTITSSSGNLVITKVVSIPHHVPCWRSRRSSPTCSAATTEFLATTVKSYLEAGEPTLKKALNKVRFKVLKDMTTRL